MKSAAEIDSPRVLLSKPEYEWEKRCCTGKLPTINEGPAILSRDGNARLIYSASGSWSDEYCLGMLTFTGGDPLDPKAWKKHPVPVFEKTEGAYGPGHCSFTISPDGSEDWMIYHANPVSRSGWGGRRLFMQKVVWENGDPILGSPIVNSDIPLPSGQITPSDGKD